LALSPRIRATPGTSAPARAASPRARRLRAPLLVTVWALLTLEAVGGIVIFFARLVYGETPGETLHVLAGLTLVAAYAAYQWRHWKRVRPFRSRLDYALGLFSLGFMTATLATGVVLAVPWWSERIVAASSTPVEYPFWLSAVHNVASVMVLAFVAAHLGAVLLRDRRNRD